MFYLQGVTKKKKQKKNFGVAKKKWNFIQLIREFYSSLSLTEPWNGKRNCATVSIFDLTEMKLYPL